ncbi:hypothetical protein R1A27_24010 [Methylobacterium sp. NMS12]|uniref:hypothetical protein n=1 Tax=Methylobacterium sp. NMS12 TaxID=3079766 RepID=UPI003F884111
MLTAIEPEIPGTDRGVHEGAMVGLGLRRMGVRPEVAAADAHPLDRDGARLLQGPDELDLE